MNSPTDTLSRDVNSTTLLSGKIRHRRFLRRYAENENAAEMGRPVCAATLEERLGGVEDEGVTSIISW